MDTQDPNIIIERLGGTSAVARIFNIAPSSVTGWRTDGIPNARLMYLKLARPEVFEESPVDPVSPAH